MAKRHHYVPRTYLDRFSDPEGFLRVFRKDPPHGPFRQKPEATGFERYYYSHIREDGTRDDDRFERLFSEVETDWPDIVINLQARRAEFEKASQLIVFLGLMRVRGPAFRDTIELSMGDLSLAQLKSLDAAGRLPPPPVGFENLIDNVQVAIDPQQSLEAMARILPDIGQLFGSLSWDVLHNATDVPFITSDNPVIYYDPKVTSARRFPYTIRPDGPVEALFPVTPRMLLRGRTSPARPPDRPPHALGATPRPELQPHDRPLRLQGRFRLIRRRGQYDRGESRGFAGRPVRQGARAERQPVWLRADGLRTESDETEMVTFPSRGANPHPISMPAPIRGE